MLCISRKYQEIDSGESSAVRLECVQPSTVMGTCVSGLSAATSVLLLFTCITWVKKVFV